MGQVIDDSNLTRIITDNIIRTYKKPITQKVVLFSVYLYVNPLGKIDSVGYSQMRAGIRLQEILNTKILFHDLKDSKLLINRKNSLVIIPFMIWSSDNISATYINELLGDFSGLFPPPELLHGRKLVLNKPQSITIAIDVD